MKPLQDLRYAARYCQAQALMPQQLFSYQGLLATLLYYLKAPVTLSPTKWAQALSQARINSLLELGCGHQAAFLHWLNGVLPANIKLFGLDPYASAKAVGRLRIVRGEAADVNKYLQGHKVDLIISCGMFSRRQLLSKQRDLIDNSRSVVLAGLEALSPNPFSALVFASYSVDMLLFDQAQFAQFGRVRYFKSFGSFPRTGQIVVLSK